MDKATAENEPESILVNQKLAAFSDFLHKGIEFVKLYHPTQVDFVLAHKDISYPELWALLQTEQKVKFIKPVSSTGK